MSELTVRAYVQLTVSVKIPSMKWDHSMTVSQAHKEAARLAVRHLEELFKSSGEIDCHVASPCDIVNVTSTTEETRPGDAR